MNNNHGKHIKIKNVLFALLSFLVLTLLILEHRAHIIQYIDVIITVLLVICCILMMLFMAKDKSGE